MSTTSPHQGKGVSAQKHQHSRASRTNCNSKQAVAHPGNTPTVLHSKQGFTASPDYKGSGAARRNSTGPQFNSRSPGHSKVPSMEFEGGGQDTDGLAPKDGHQQLDSSSASGANSGNNNQQYRNSKNRKLYTSIGHAYGPSHPQKFTQGTPVPTSGGPPAVVVPQNAASLYQNSQGTSQKQNRQSLNQSMTAGYQPNSNTNSTTNQGRPKGSSNGKERSNKIFASSTKNGKKAPTGGAAQTGQNSGISQSFINLQPRDLHTPVAGGAVSGNQYHLNQPVKPYSSTMAAVGNEPRISNGLAVAAYNPGGPGIMSADGHGRDQQVTFAQGQVYQSMINQDPNNVSTNVNDISVLSGGSHSVNLGLMQQQSAGTTQNYDSQLFDKREQTKKGRKVPAKQAAKVGNFMEQSEKGTKKLLSKMVTASQASQNQMNFMNNFSVDESALSQSALDNSVEVVSNGVFNNTSHNIREKSNILITNQQQIADLQKQRPHSSFKAQTQKQLNTFKTQLLSTNQGPSKQQPNRAQQIMIGANGVVGIAPNQPFIGSNLGVKTVGSRKNKHFPVGNKHYTQNLQNLNQTSVYQNEMDVNTRESRRVGRGSSGFGMSGPGIDLNVPKDHRELRTSSATAGNTNTEFQLMNMIPGVSGNVNLHNYMLGSTTNAISNTSGISGFSGGASTNIQFLKNSQAPSSKQVNSTQKQSKQAIKSTKLSKKSIQAPNAFNFSGNNILSSTNISLQNQQQPNPDQIAFMQNIDSMRSGQESRANSKMLQKQGSAKQKAYGINQFPAGKHESAMNKPTGNKNYLMGTGAQSVLSNASQLRVNNYSVVNAATNNTLQNDAHKAHQHSMQKFLQQQMTNLNTGGMQSKKKAKPSQKSQMNQTSVNIYSQTTQLQNKQGSASNITEQIYNNKMSSQKLSTKKQQVPQSVNQLASDRIRGMRESSNGRKSAATTVTNGKRAVLNSSQIQMKPTNPIAKGVQNVSRSRGASKHNSQNAPQGATRSGGGALSVIGGVKQGVGVFPLGEGNIFNQLGVISGTPGIQGNSKITLIGNGPTNQRNYFSNAQNTNQSNKLIGTNSKQEGNTYNQSSRRGKKGPGTSCGTITSGGGIASATGGGSKKNGGIRHGNEGQIMATVDFMQFNKTQATQQLESHVNSFDYKGQPVQAQIQVAEQATREMKTEMGRLLNNGAYSLNQMTTDLSDIHQTNQQFRPKSQNDVQTYDRTVNEDIISSKQDADALSQQDKELQGISDIEQLVNAQSRTIVRNRDRCETTDSPEQPGHFVDLKSQERKLNDEILSHKRKSRPEGDISQKNDFSPQPMDIQSISREQQYLDVLHRTFNKIASSLHPKVGGPLAQVRDMYEHLMQKMDQQNQLALHQQAIQISQLQELLQEARSQQPQKQTKGARQTKSKSQQQMQELMNQISTNEELVAELKKTSNEKKTLQSQINKIQAQLRKEEGKSTNLQEQLENVQKHLSSESGRVNISKNVIYQMKNSVDKKKEGIENIRRAERNERTKEDVLDPDSRPRDLTRMLNFKDDPLNLDGPIGPIAASQHVRITNGEIIEQSKGNGRQGGGGKVPNKPSRRGLEDDEYSSEAEARELLNSIPNIDMANLPNDKEPRRSSGAVTGAVMEGIVQGDDFMIFEDDNMNFENIRDIEIAEAEKHNSRRNRYSREEDGDPIVIDSNAVLHQSESQGQSYKSWSSTIDSEMLEAYQQAMAQNQPPPPNFMFEQTDNQLKHSAQDKSPIKVPALNFQKMMEQKEIEIQQEQMEAVQQEQQEDNEATYPDYGEEDPGLNDQIMIHDNNLDSTPLPMNPPPQLGLKDPSSNKPKGLGLGLNLGKVKEVEEARGFQDEFMEKINEFSESWRMLLEREKRF